MKIIFIRHTSLNIEKGICYGQSDIDVSSQFMDEALKVKNSLDGYIVKSREIKVYSSPLIRCIKLCNFCGFDPIIDKRLLEVNYGDWEGEYWSKIDDPNLKLWYDDWVNVRATNGESLFDLYDRVSFFIDNLNSDSKESNNIVFTHGGVIICAIKYSKKCSWEEALALNPDYGQITELFFD